MSIDISSISQQRSHRSVVEPITPSPKLGAAGKGVEPEIKEFSATVDAVGDARNNTGAEQQLEPVDVDNALSNLNDYAQNFQRDINFTVDEATNKTVIRVIDSATEEVIRQIPSEDILELARKLEQFEMDNKGALIHAQA